ADLVPDLEGSAEGGMRDLGDEITLDLLRLHFHFFRDPTGKLRRADFELRNDALDAQRRAPNAAVGNVQRKAPVETEVCVRVALRVVAGGAGEADVDDRLRVRWIVRTEERRERFPAAVSRGRFVGFELRDVGCELLANRGERRLLPACDRFSNLLRRYR